MHSLVLTSSAALHSVPSLDEKSKPPFNEISDRTLCRAQSPPDQPRGTCSSCPTQSKLIRRGLRGRLRNSHLTLTRTRGECFSRGLRRCAGCLSSQLSGDEFGLAVRRWSTPRFRYSRESRLCRSASREMARRVVAEKAYGAGIRASTLFSLPREKPSEIQVWAFRRGHRASPEKLPLLCSASSASSDSDAGRPDPASPAAPPLGKYVAGRRHPFRGRTRYSCSSPYQIR